MNNGEIVKILLEIADLLDLKGENVFKSRAYQKAARSIELLSEEVSNMVTEDRLKEIPGVGDAIARKLTELVTTGRLEYYDKLKAEFPRGIDALLEVPGIGPRTAVLLARELQLENIDDLEKAILDGRVARLPRMGEKTAQNLLHQIQNFRKQKNDHRIPLGLAIPVAESLIDELKKIPGLSNLTVTGSLRRFRDYIGDIDFVGTSDNPSQALQTFTRLPLVREILEVGESKASVILLNGIQMDLRIFNADSIGAALQYSTGSQQHNIELRKRAERIGLSLSEYGITEIATGKLEKYPTEEAFYRRLGLEYIPPEIREGLHEIVLAEQNALPRLLEISDIRGDLHIHTHWSDGNASIEEMTAAAIERGYEYIGITDHSVSLGIAHGLDVQRLKQQILEIRAINRKYSGFRILAGMEVDVKADGSLDMPDEILDELDVVLASIHSGMNQEKDQMTLRIVRAMQNPRVNILSHPTGRLLGERGPINVDMETLFKAALDNNIALEISAMPSRLDLKDTHVYQARGMGIKMIINTDSHRPEHLDFMRFGIGTARRGWCEKKNVLNTLSLEKLMDSLRK